MLRQIGGAAGAYKVCVSLLERNGLTPDDVDVLLLHQANGRIVNAVAQRLGIPSEKAVLIIDRYGNTTGATIPLATREALETGKLKKGDLALMAAVGAGLTVGAALWRWDDE